ncbi:hypothetical protein, partial [Castellaniella defragrans]|uniref:hypothetical protein n=1 Tax=Castellaniella defragrans TaxID=75697 RepID=UPI0023F4025A
EIRGLGSPEIRPETGQMNFSGTTIEIRGLGSPEIRPETGQMNFSGTTAYQYSTTTHPTQSRMNPGRDLANAREPSREKPRAERREGAKTGP